MGADSAPTPATDLYDPSALEVIFGARRWALLTGDCLDVLDRIPSRSIDSIVCDPPAGVSFMGKDWDSDKGGRDEWIAWLAERMREAWRVLKPGAHALVWALPRTSHWTGMALENAGFEIRDVISHIFASGFPKSVDVSKEIDRRAGAAREVIGADPQAARRNKATAKFASYGSAEPLGESCPITAPATPDAATWAGWGTALKPACEYWFLIRKPLDGTIAANVMRHGVGAINIDGCRVEHASPGDLAAHSAGVEAIRARGGSFDNSWKNSSDLAGANPVTSSGRWPAHLLISHGPGCKRTGTRKIKADPAWYETERTPSAFTGAETSPIHHADADGLEEVAVWECADGCPAKLLDEQSGDRGVSGSAWTGHRTESKDNGLLGMGRDGYGVLHADSGGAARYFTQFAYEPDALDYDPFVYSAKASTAEREKGCEHLPAQNLTGRKDDSAGTESPRAGAGRKGRRRNIHPTTKSVALMRWLVRLITPPGGVVLDPFAGSFSTGVACSAERLRVIGVELDPAYVAIGRARFEGDSPLLNRGAGL